MRKKKSQMVERVEEEGGGRKERVGKGLKKNLTPMSIESNPPGKDGTVTLVLFNESRPKKPQLFNWTLIFERERESVEAANQSGLLIS